MSGAPGPGRGSPGGRGWTLRRRVGAVIILIAVISVVVGIWSGYQSWGAGNTLTQLQSTLIPASTNLAAVEAVMVDEDSAVGAYLASGDRALLQTFSAGEREMPRLLGALDPELAGQPSDRALLATVGARYTRRLDRTARPEVAAAGAGDPATVNPSDPPGPGEGDYGALRHSVVQLDDTVQSQLDAGVGSSVSQVNVLFGVAVIRVGVILLALALTWFVLLRWVNDPIEMVVAEVRAVALGELDRPISSSGTPETALLGESLESMRQQLRNEADEVRQLRQALVTNQPLHMLVRSELEPSTHAPGANVAGRLVPVEGVLAGDWYEVWQPADLRITVAMVDVSGHGPAAGLFALRLKYLLLPALRSGLDPGQAMDWVAQECGEADERFATGIVLDLDLARGRCRYANAGHPSGILVRKDGTYSLGPTGPIMCLIPGSHRTEEMEIGEGDLLGVTTDGLIEARLPDGSEFGMERVQSLLEAQARDAPADVVLEQLFGAVIGSSPVPLRDDATAVVIRLGRP